MRASGQRFAAIAIALLAATPAAALSGPELFSDLCLAAFPRFTDAPQLAEKLGGTKTRYDASLFEQIKMSERASFMFSDGPGTVEHLMLSLAWGNLDARRAASCVVIEKLGMALDDIGAKIDIKEIRLRREKVVYSTFADAVAERPDGRRLFLTLMLMPGQTDPRNGKAIAAVTLIAAEALDALIERPR